MQVLVELVLPVQLVDLRCAKHRMIPRAQIAVLNTIRSHAE